MKRVIWIFLLFAGLCLALPANLYADATDQSGSGTATVNDLDMYGKDVFGVNVFETGLIRSSKVIDKDNPAYVLDPDQASIMQRVQVTSSPTNGFDVANKAYVDIYENQIVLLIDDIQSLNEQIEEVQEDLEDCQHRLASGACGYY